MDGNELWTDQLPDEVIELLVEQCHGHFFDWDPMQIHYTEFDYRTVWTWEEEE